MLMPFRPELHYFYLYLKQHIQDRHNLRCERADDALDAEDAFIDTIISNIQKADVIIADCTGHNPNVLYELGLAHAYGKPVLPIMQTADPARDIPSDLRHRTFILYQLDRHVEFFDELDTRLQHMMAQPTSYYQKAHDLFDQFTRDTGISGVRPVDELTFNGRISRLRIPAEDDAFGFADAMMANIFPLDVSTDIRQHMLTWLLDKFGGG